MSIKYFKNYTNVAVYTSTEDANKIDFYIKNKWLQVDLADFESAIREGDGNFIREDFFLENLIKLSPDERKRALDRIEEDFDLVGPSYCRDETNGFDNNSDMEALFEIYGISYSEHCSIEPNDGDCYYSSDLSGKVIGKYVLEQLGERYIVPMVVICTGEQYVEGFDFKNIKEIKGGGN